LGGDIWTVQKDVSDISMVGVKWRMQRGESFRPSCLNEREGSKVSEAKAREREYSCQIV